MIPILPFGLGVAAGAVIVGIVKKVLTSGDLEKTKDELKKAAVSGLSSIETAASTLKDKINSSEEPKQSTRKKTAGKAKTTKDKAE